MLDDGSIAATRDRWTTSIRRSRTERTGAAEAAVLSRWIVVVLACLGYSRSELRVGGENIRVRKRKRGYQFHQRWRATSVQNGALQNLPFWARSSDERAQEHDALTVAMQV
jgi:hypothetical protein